MIFGSLQTGHGFPLILSPLWRNTATLFNDGRCVWSINKNSRTVFPWKFQVYSKWLQNCEKELKEFLHCKEAFVHNNRVEIFFKLWGSQISSALLSLMKHCIVMVCELFGNSNLSRHVELVLAGYKSTGVSWLHAWTFFYVSIWMSWNIQITWTIYLSLIKYQSGFIGGKRPRHFI